MTKDPLINAQRRLHAENVRRLHLSLKSMKLVGKRIGVTHQRVSQILLDHKPLTDEEVEALESRVRQLEANKQQPNGPLVSIYFIRPKRRKGPIKIGSSLSPPDRLFQIEQHSPLPLEIVGFVSGTRSDESLLHRYLSEHRSHGEWFHARPAVIAAMREVLCFGIEHARENYLIEVQQ